MPEKRAASSIGMFDMIKGMGTVLIVFGHTFSPLIMAHEVMSIFEALVILLLMQLGNNALIPAFLIMSGYGFRKRSLSRCIKQQFELLLRPYIYALIGVTVLHFMTRYIMFRSLRSALSATWSITGGFLLALPDSIKIGNRTYYSCAALWFLVALFVAWIMLDLIMEKIPEKYRFPAIFSVSIMGWLIGINRVTPFCISQGMIAVLYLYIGYRSKKNRLLIEHWPKTRWFCFILLLFVGMLISIFTPIFGDSMSSGHWAVGPISILLDGFLAILLLHILLQLNGVSCKLLNALSEIGRNSFYIFIVHSVEIHGIPWYLIMEKTGGEGIYSDVIIFSLRLIIIAFGVFMIKSVSKLKKSTI